MTLKLPKDGNTMKELGFFEYGMILTKSILYLCYTVIFLPHCFYYHTNMLQTQKLSMLCKTGISVCLIHLI